MHGADIARETWGKLDWQPIALIDIPIVFLLDFLLRYDTRTCARDVRLEAHDLHSALYDGYERPHGSLRFLSAFREPTTLYSNGLGCEDLMGSSAGCADHAVIGSR